jgi:hypothetical protein
LAIAGALVTAAGCATAASAAARAKPTSIKLSAHSKLLRASSVDNPPTGRSPGDQLLFSERLFSPAGRPIGTDAASCVVLFDQRSLCTGAYLLNGGQLMVALVQPGLSGSRNYEQAITGATGRYAGASGTVTVRQRPAGDQFVFHIRLPSS